MNTLKWTSQAPTSTSFVLTNLWLNHRCVGAYWHEPGGFRLATGRKQYPCERKARTVLLNRALAKMMSEAKDLAEELGKL